MKKILSFEIIILIILLTFSSVNSYQFKDVYYFEEQNHDDSIIGDNISAWPQQGYNSTHIGRSPYSTSYNFGIEKWRFKVSICEGSPSIGPDGCIYFGCGDCYLYSVFPNGTLNWKKQLDSYAIGFYGSQPAIGGDGSIYYCPKEGNFINALNSDGSLKWRYESETIDTSITIKDEILYYGHRGGGVDVRYTNGTLKWRYNTSNIVQSTPAVDKDGIVYFGCNDYYIRALYPNGSLNWKYLTDYRVTGSPTISNNKTIYCGSGDEYFYALNPNGTLKWKILINTSMRCSPALDRDGNIYFGTEDGRIFSIKPSGDIGWVYDLGWAAHVWGSSPAISDDDVLYLVSYNSGNYNSGGKINALDLNGNLLFQKSLTDYWGYGCYSSPVIGKDGTVYFCSKDNDNNFLHAFGGYHDNGPPDAPSISGDQWGRWDSPHDFHFKSEDDDLSPVRYFIDWDDGTNETTSYCYPGAFITIYHTWYLIGRFTVKCKAIDTFGLESDWSYYEIICPINTQFYNNPLIELFKDRFPIIYDIMIRLIGGLKN